MSLEVATWLRINRFVERLFLGEMEHCHPFWQLAGRLPKCDERCGHGTKYSRPPGRADIAAKQRKEARA